jgi:hypothetical protein
VVPAWSGVFLVFNSEDQTELVSSRLKVSAYVSLIFLSAAIAQADECSNVRAKLAADPKIMFDNEVPT